jgi:5-methylcytosine-specific restriction endonuclease McrA
VRQCKRCGGREGAVRFPSYRGGYCVDCAKVHRRELYLANHARDRAKQAQYYRRNSDAVKARAKAWERENRERKRARDRAWKKANRARLNERERARRRRNPATVRASDQRRNRRAVLSGAKAARRAARGSGGHAYGRLLLRDPCAYCGVAATAIDHIDPLVGGGAAHWDNLTAACGPCNSAKHATPLLLFLLGVGRAT